MKIKITDFAKRQFSIEHTGTKITDVTPEQFEKSLNGMTYNKTYLRIDNGYADFCKILFVDNITDATVSSLPITNENHQYLRSGYHARTENELPVLTRWFDFPVKGLPKAKYLMVILYDKAQIEKEDNIEFDADYGVVSIMAIDTLEEEPMSPITMMRNALGIEEGGSGVALDREKYKKSVEYWNTHAIVR